MSEDSDEPEVGLETVPPDGYLQPTRYRTTCRCRRCGHVYSWTSKSPPKHDKPCPRVECSEMAQLQATLRETQNLVKMLMEQRAPAHIGESNIVKAVDATAEIVMKDYGMTNLQDNIRHGEAVAPKLPPVQQQAADAYFGGGTAKTRRCCRPRVRVAWRCTRSRWPASAGRRWRARFRPSIRRS